MSMFEGMEPTVAVLSVLVAIAVAIIQVLKTAKQRALALVALLTGVVFLIGGAWMKQSPAHQAPSISKALGTDDDDEQEDTEDPPATDTVEDTQRDALPQQVVVDPEVPIKFVLNDGEQNVLLGGQASVGIAFSRVGTVDVATLRMYGDEGRQTQAMLTRGKQFKLKVKGNLYFVAITKLDFSTRQAEIQVDRMAG